MVVGRGCISTSSNTAETVEFFLRETIKLGASLSMEIAFLSREDGWGHSLAVESWGVGLAPDGSLALAVLSCPSSESACWLYCPCNLRFVSPAGNHQRVFTIKTSVWCLWKRRSD